MNHAPNHIHKLSQTTTNLWNNMSTGDRNLSLIPSKNCVSSIINCSNLSKFPQQRQIQAWQNASPEQPCASLVKNRLASEGCYHTLETPGFPPSDLLPEISQSCNDKHINFISNVYQSPQNGLSSKECSPLSSCMFENHSPLSTNADQQHPQAQAVTISSCSKSTLPINQSPPQASCYFQWACSEPLVGTSSIPQEDTCISPPSCQIGPGIATLDSHSVFQRYLDCNGHV